jgi:hypothetical protein
VLSRHPQHLRLGSVLLVRTNLLDERVQTLYALALTHLAERVFIPEVLQFWVNRLEILHFSVAMLVADLTSFSAVAFVKALHVSSP